MYSRNVCSVIWKNTVLINSVSQTLLYILDRVFDRHISDMKILSNLFVFLWCLHAKECRFIITSSWTQRWVGGTEEFRPVGYRMEGAGVHFVDRWTGRNRHFLVCGLIRRQVCPPALTSPQQHSMLFDFSPLSCHHLVNLVCTSKPCSHGWYY